jgi:hypothetical protein
MGFKTARNGIIKAICGEVVKNKARFTKNRKNNLKRLKEIRYNYLNLEEKYYVQN